MAVKPPEDVLADVAAAVLDAQRTVAHSVPVGLRWEQPERYHLTLQFLGPVVELAPVVDGLAAAAGGQSAFPFRLGGAGAFPKPGRARVVWLGAETGGGELAGLAGAVGRALAPLGYEPDRKELHPHLTVARLKVPGDVREVLATFGPEPIGGPFTAAELVLYESRLSPKGPTYTALARFPLGGA